MAMGSDFGGNLTDLLESKGISAYRLSMDTGFSQSLISDWKKGKSVPNSDKLVTLAQYFGVSTDRLLGNPRAAEKMLLPLDELAGIPILGVIRAGLPVFCEENFEGYELAGVRNPREHFFLRVTGDSMVGAGIRDGSLVLIRKQEYADNGQIVACLIDSDTATLKRYKKQGELILLLPENSEYEPYVLREEEFRSGAARILGIAVSVTTPL